MINYTTPSIPAVWMLSNNQFVNSANVYSVIGSNPKVFSSAENVINYIFNNDVNAGSHNASELRLNVFGSVGTTGSITLTNDFMTIILTPSDLPSVNQFFRNGGGTSPAQRTIIAQSIAYELRTNLTFNQYYNTYAQGATVFIKARTVGARYNFNLSSLDSGIIVLGGVSRTFTPSTNLYEWQSLIDYNAFVEVYVAEGIYGQTINKNYSILTDIYSVLPTSEAVWSINIADSVKHYVDVVLPTKRTSPVVVVKELDKQIDSLGNPLLPIVRPFYHVWGAEYRFAEGLEKKKFVSGVSDVRFVLNGAFGLLEDYNFMPYILDITTTVPAKFMTSSPKDKDTDYDSHEYIHFYKKYNDFELGSFGIEVTFTFYDNTSVIQSYALPTQTINGTISIDVSPNVLKVLNIEAINGKLVDKYELKLYWTISSLLRYYSESKIYNMKRICNTKVNNVIFLNEFGVFETLNFTGEVLKNINREAE